MSILDKLMEKKDLKTYIEYRIKFLEQESEAEMLKQPESERGFIQERFHGRILELVRLKSALCNNKIKYYSKIYYKNMRQKYDRTRKNL